MLPENHGQYRLYARAAIWRSSPSIDVSRRLVYIATGNLYSSPPAMQAFESARLNKTNPPVADPCIEPDDHSESILAINIDTGKIACAKLLGGYDTWTIPCMLDTVPSPNCPTIIGHDYDFGEAPLLVTIKEPEGLGSSCRWRDIVVAGQKNGVIHALDAATGELVWQTAVGPGGYGGVSWGLSTDGNRVFTCLINSAGANFTVVPSSSSLLKSVDSVS